MRKAKKVKNYVNQRYKVFQKKGNDLFYQRWGNRIKIKKNISQAEIFSKKMVEKENNFIIK